MTYISRVLSLFISLLFSFSVLAAPVDDDKENSSLPLVPISNPSVIPSTSQDPVLITAPSVASSTSQELVPVVPSSQALVPVASTEVEGIFVNHIPFDINPLKQDLLLGIILSHIARDKAPIQLEGADAHHRACTGKGTICSVHALKNLRLVSKRFNTFIVNSILKPDRFLETTLAQAYLDKYPYTFGNQGLSLDTMNVELSRAYWRNWRGALIHSHKERVFKRLAFESADHDVWAYALNEGQDADTYVESHTRHSLYEDDFNMIRQLPQDSREIDLSLRVINVLPPEIGLFTSVEKLNLKLNSFSFLPHTLGNLSTLKELDLSFCDLKALPWSLRNLQKLEVLNVAGNKLTKLPTWLAEMPNLKKIYLMLNPLDEFFESIGFEPDHDEVSVLGHKLSPTCIFTCKFQMGQVSLVNLPALQAALKNNLGKI